MLVNRNISSTSKDTFKTIVIQLKSMQLHKYSLNFDVAYCVYLDIPNILKTPTTDTQQFW